MARSRGQGRAGRAAPAASAAPAGLGLFDLPTALLEAIILLLPLKLRCRFSTTCRTAYQLAGSSSILFRSVAAGCHSRMQSLALLRWLGARSRGCQGLELALLPQCVPVDRQLQQGLTMQSARLEELIIETRGVAFKLDGDWVTSMARLRVLKARGSGIELGSSCSQLAALRQLSLRCGAETPSANMIEWNAVVARSNTVILQPGCIPLGLSSVSFYCCSVAELPAALCSATGLKELRLGLCAVDWQKGDPAGPALGPTLSQLTALETLQLRRLQLEKQTSVPALLAGLTRLRHLDVAESLLTDASEQAVCSLSSQLTCLTLLSLGFLGSRGNLQAGVGSLPSLRELRLVLPPQCKDHRLPLVAAAPRLQSLMVCATSLLCESNLELLRELPDLRNLAIIMPPDADLAAELEEDGAQQLIDTVACLPALEYALVLYGSEQMAQEPWFDSLLGGLREAALRVVPLPYSYIEHLPVFWPKWTLARG